MKRHSNLWPRVISIENLLSASKRASRGGKKFQNHIANFLFHLETEVLVLHRELIKQTYIPSPYRQFYIYDPKKRCITVAHFRDRVIHHALWHYLGPILDHSMIPTSYACRKNKGMHLALKEVMGKIRNQYFLKIDIRKYFESICHTTLQQTIERKIKDRQVLWLISTILKNVPPPYSEGRGVPIGNLTSQHFANYFLNSLDHYIKEKLKIKHYYRYMDDMLLLHEEKIVLSDALQEIYYYLQDQLDLQMNIPATRLAHIKEGIPFLGFILFRNHLFIQKKNWRRIKRKIIKRQQKYLEGKISEEYLIRSVASMMEFLKTGDTQHLRKKFLENHWFEV